MILGIADITNDELRRLVARFTIKNHKYADPKTARGDCAAVSTQFLMFLQLEEYGGSRKVQNWKWDIYNFTSLTSGPPVPHEFFRDHHYGSHVAVLVDGWYIDFTARQFSHDAPFPLIWKEDWQDHAHVLQQEGRADRTAGVGPAL